MFELGSLLCAVSVNSKMLIVSRAVAGAGAAGLVTGTFSIIAHVTPLDKRPGKFSQQFASTMLLTVLRYTLVSSVQCLVLAQLLGQSSVGL